MKAVTESTIARRAASDCIDRCTQRPPRKAADYPHDVVYVVTTHYTGTDYRDTMAFHADDAALAREYAKQLRIAHREDGFGITRRAVPIEEFLAS